MQLTYGDLVLPQDIPTEFVVNKALLSWFSDFFRGCSELQGAKLSIIELKDVDAAILQGYVFYLYKRQIRFADGEKTTLDHVPLLIDLYIFADKYDSMLHRNEVVDRVWVLLAYDEVDQWPWAAIGKAFSHLPVTAMLYKLLMADVCYVLEGSDRDMCSMIITHFPPEAAISVMHYLVSKTAQRALLCPQYEPRTASGLKAPKEYIERKEEEQRDGL